MGDSKVWNWTYFKDKICCKCKVKGQQQISESKTYFVRHWHNFFNVFGHHVIKYNLSIKIFIWMNIFVFQITQPFFLFSPSWYSICIRWISWDNNENIKFKFFMYGNAFEMKHFFKKMPFRFTLNFKNVWMLPYT